MTPDQADLLIEATRAIPLVIALVGFALFLSILAGVLRK